MLLAGLFMFESSLYSKVEIFQIRKVENLSVLFVGGFNGAKIYVWKGIGKGAWIGIYKLSFLQMLIKPMIDSLINFVFFT